MTRLTITPVEGGDMQFIEESARGGSAWELRAKLRYKRVEALPGIDDLRSKRSRNP